VPVIPVHRGVYSEKFGAENSKPNKNQFGQTLNNRRGQHGKYTVENDLFVTISKIQNYGILLQDHCTVVDELCAEFCRTASFEGFLLLAFTGFFGSNFAPLFK
jgi:hypothetical protein